MLAKSIVFWKKKVCRVIHRSCSHTSSYKIQLLCDFYESGRHMVEHVFRRKLVWGNFRTEVEQDRPDHVSFRTQGFLWKRKTKKNLPSKVQTTVCCSKWKSLRRNLKPVIKLKERSRYGRNFRKNLENIIRRYELTRCVFVS